MNIIPDTDEHKEQPQTEQNAFKLRIAAERKAEAEELEKRQQQEEVMRGLKSRGLTSIPIPTPKPKPKQKKEPKPKKTKKPRKKKSPKKTISLKIEPIVKSPPKLPVYNHQVEVNEFNKFKVDYIRKQIYHCKDARRKEIYVNALTKYDMTNYHNLK